MQSCSRPPAADVGPGWLNLTIRSARAARGLRTAACLLVAAFVSLETPKAAAAELVLDFGTLAPGTPPSTFRPALTGGGPPPQWQVLQVDAPSALPAFPDRPKGTTRETVIAQVSQDPTDERFPLLIYEKEEFGDFTAVLRFRTVSGRVERMAGLAFRLRDERNYYVVRASSLGNSLRFYKFVDGVRSEPIGPEMRIPAGEWHSLEVTCKGNTILCRLDGHDGIPLLTDTSFVRGKLALWTKSDSVSHFGGLRVTYDLVKTVPQRLVDRAMERYPKLLGVTVFARVDGRTVAVASSAADEVGQAGGAAEEKALAEGLIQAGAAAGSSSALYPLRDRNGDPLFAVRLKLRTFPGQTEANVASRGKPIVDHLESLVRAAELANDSVIPAARSSKN